jgi:HD superfamily phosphodiesterase
MLTIFKILFFNINYWNIAILTMFVIHMSTIELFNAISNTVLPHLRKNLPKDLYYHCIEHTIDVEKEAVRIALNENINNTEELFLLKVACLYHDSGFLFTYREHEVAGCNLAKKELPAFGLDQQQIDIICGLIMATRIPQTPLTKLEEVICDADLDYLGREDFLPISHNLFLELKARKFITTEKEWNQIQINFFKQHAFFTETNKRLRTQKKSHHLEMIEAIP